MIRRRFLVDSGLTFLDLVSGNRLRCRGLESAHFPRAKYVESISSLGAVPLGPEYVISPLSAEHTANLLRIENELPHALDDPTQGPLSSLQTKQYGGVPLSQEKGEQFASYAQTCMSHLDDILHRDFPVLDWTPLTTGQDYSSGFQNKVFMGSQFLVHVLHKVTTASRPKEIYFFRDALPSLTGGFYVAGDKPCDDIGFLWAGIFAKQYTPLIAAIHLQLRTHEQDLLTPDVDTILLSTALVLGVSCYHEMKDLEGMSALGPIPNHQKFHDYFLRTARGGQHPLTRPALDYAKEYGARKLLALFEESPAHYPSQLKVAL